MTANEAAWLLLCQLAEFTLWLLLAMALVFAVACLFAAVFAAPGWVRRRWTARRLHRDVASFLAWHADRPGYVDAQA